MGIGSDRREEGGGRGKKRREEMRGNERRGRGRENGKYIGQENQDG